MSAEQLQPGWRKVKFGDVVRDVKNTTKDPARDGLHRVVGLDHLDPESLPLRRWDELADLPDGTSFTRTFKAGQVLFGKRRAYQRKVAVPDFDGICSGDILVFEPSSPDLLPEFLPYLVQSDGFFDHALGTSAGSLSPRTKWQELAKYEFALPPLDEQKRIVDALAAADGVSATCEDVELAASQLVGAIIEEHLADCLATGVPYLAVEELLTERPRNGLAMRRDSADGDFWTVSLSAVRDGELVLQGSLKRTSFTPEAVAPFLLSGGEFLVVRGNGNRDLVGRACIVREVRPGLFHHDKLIRLRWDSERIDPEYALQIWNSRSVFSRLNSAARGSNGIFMINADGIRRHHMHTPALDVQREIVDLLSAARATGRSASRTRRSGRSAAGTIREQLLVGGVG